MLVDICRRLARCAHTCVKKSSYRECRPFTDDDDDDDDDDDNNNNAPDSALGTKCKASH